MGKMKYLICHLTSPNHMIKGSFNFVEWKLLIEIEYPRNIIVLVCHKMLQDQVIDRLSNFMGRSQSR